MAGRTARARGTRSGAGAPRGRRRRRLARAARRTSTGFRTWRAFAGVGVRFAEKPVPSGLRGREVPVGRALPRLRSGGWGASRLCFGQSRRRGRVRSRATANVVAGWRRLARPYRPARKVGKFPGVYDLRGLLRSRNMRHRGAKFSSSAGGDRRSNCRVQIRRERFHFSRDGCARCDKEVATKHAPFGVQSA